MNTLDSILNGIKFNQQETAKKQDSYLDDGHIFDFSNALQFANQSNNFSFDAVQNNSNDIISQHSVSATPYSATATAHDNSYQKSLDEAVSKYNLNKSSDDGYSHKENNAVSNSNDNNYEGRTSADKADDKEVQASAKESGRLRFLASDASIRGNNDQKLLKAAFHEGLVDLYGVPGGYSMKL